MKNIRFQTDYRLWLWTALALFFASWFFPIIIDKAGGTPIERIRWQLNFAAYGNTTFDRILLGTSVQAVFSMVISIFLAWFVQVAIVIVRTTRQEIFNRIINPRRFFQFGISVAVLMAIFPPWTDTYIAAAPSPYWQDLQCSIGYSFILTPEKPFDHSHVIAMDISRLVGQWIGLALVMGCVSFYRRPNRRLLLIASGLFACVLTASVITGYSRTPYFNSKQLVDGQVSDALKKMGGLKGADGKWIFPNTKAIQSQTN